MPLGLWPFRPAPFPDELLTSWMARLAHAHGLQPGSLLRILEPKYPDFATVDWTARPELCALLATHTEVPYQVVHGLVLGFGSDPDLRDLVHHNWQGPALQYCAACLAQDVPYYRRSWRLACFRLCPQHHTILLDACLHCGSTIRLDDLLPPHSPALCQNCGNGLAGCSEVQPRGARLEKLLDIEQRIADTILINYTQALPNYPKSFPTVHVGLRSKMTGR